MLTFVSNLGKDNKFIIYRAENNINFQISKHLVSLRLNFKNIRQVEPPSPILKDQKISADQMSDDPLSHIVYIVMGSTSGESREGVFCVRSTTIS